jgi:hypothetical protein
VIRDEYSRQAERKGMRTRVEGKVGKGPIWKIYTILCVLDISIVVLKELLVTGMYSDIFILFELFLLYRSHNLFDRLLRLHLN